MANDINIKIKLDSADKIISKRGLQRGGSVQLFFTNEVAGLCDPYVPFRNGGLKDNKDVTAEYIHYTSSYAAKQYYTNRGNGLRGKYWDRRMWADRGHEIVQSVQKYMDGKG